MNLKLIKALSVVAIVLLTLCHKTEQLIKTDTTRIDTKSTAKIMKAFLMQCPYNFSSQNNVQVTVQIAMHTLTNKNTDSFVGKILLGELSDSNRTFTCDLTAPSMVDVSNEDYVLMYPFKIENVMQPNKENSGSVKPVYSNGANTNLNRIETDEDVHTGNSVKLLDDIYYTGLKPSDFFKRSDFMHTNPKDFRRDSICTKNFRKDNNKNNANNEYANEEFYGDRNQRENENAFSRKLGMNLNNNEIDNIMSNKRMKSDSLCSMGHLTKNFFDDMDSWKRRKKIQEHKNEFIKCVGMKIFKKIDHVLCTCARNVNEVFDVYDVDETENSDTEQSDCFQLINNVCPLGPVYNKNNNYETKMNDDIRNVNYGNIKSTAFACCDLVPPFYIALGKKCYDILRINDLYVDTDNKWIRMRNSKILDELPEIVKNESDDVLDETTSYLRSNIEKDEQIIKNKIHRSDSLVKTPRITISKSAPFYDTIDTIVKIANKPMTLRHYHKKEVKPFDKDIYDPHLNIADKMQLINMISPKRPCERNRMNSEHSRHDRRKRNVDSTDQIASLTDDELDSALEDYEYSDTKLEEDLKSRNNELNEYSSSLNTSVNHRNDALKRVQKVCSQHPCALALPYKKDPYYRGRIHFLDNNGSNLNSHQIAENICHDHFNEFILIPFDYQQEK